MDYHAHRQRGEHNRADGERQYAWQVSPEAAESGEIRPIHQQWWEEKYQDQ
jgi:hypothetical protein